MSTKKSSVSKYRYWTFILYPESIPEDFVDRLEKLGLPIAISPLHDLDESSKKAEPTSSAEYEEMMRNPNAYKYKKAHYHVLYIANNPVTMESVRLKIKRILGDKSVSHIEVVDSVENMYLYLTHESSDAIKKNKHRYDKKNIVHLNDFDIDRYIHLDESQKRELKNQLLNLIRTERLVNISDLFGFLEVKGAEHGLTNMNDINDIITTSPGAFRLWFDANYQNGWRAKYTQWVDTTTGEIRN